MSKLFLHVEAIPRRIISEREAADYCALSLPAFRRLCPVIPVDLGNGRRAYDIHDLDTWLDAVKAGVVADDNEIISKLQ